MLTRPFWTRLALVFALSAVALAEGNSVPGSLSDWGCPSVESVLAGLPSGTDYMVLNLETGAIRWTPRASNDPLAAEQSTSSGVQGPGGVVHLLIQDRLKKDSRVKRIVDYKAVESRSDCKQGLFFIHDVYELDVGAAIEPDITFRLFFRPFNCGGGPHAPAFPYRPAYFCLFLEYPTVVIDPDSNPFSSSDTAQLLDAEQSAMQDIWDERGELEAQCCTEQAKLSTVLGFIHDILDQFHLTVADYRLAGEQDVVLMLAPQMAPCTAGRYYTIVNKGSGKVLGVAGGSLVDGAPAVQWDRDGTLNQEWSCGFEREGWTTIIAAHDGKLLNVANASSADGAAVIQWPRSNAENERWRFQAASGNYYAILSEHSGKALGVRSGSQERGAAVIQWSPDGTDNQLWRFDEIPPCAPGKYYTIVNKGSGKVLGVAAGSVATGALVVQWDRDGTNNQKWSCTEEQPGSFSLRAAHSGKHLNVADASLADGAVVIQFPPWNADNERWQFQAVGAGYYVIVSQHSGKVLGVAAGRQERGARIVQWRRDGTDNQAWRLDETTPPSR